MPMQLKNHCKK